MDYSWLFTPLLLSLKILLAATILNIFLGLAIAIFIAYSKSRFKFIVEVLITLPLIFPPMATGFLLLYILGKNGYIGRFMGEYSFVFDYKGLVLAAFISGLPLLIKPIQSVLEGFSTTLIEAALSCGKSKLEILLFVILPNIKKTLFASLFIAGARAVGEVGISLILGGNIIGKTDTISLAIYNAVFDGDNEKALILSMILITISLLFFIIINIFNRRKG